MNLFSLFLLQAANNQEKGTSSLYSLGLMIVLILVFWLFFIRPQSKRQKELQKKRDALKAGDEVLTSGGLHGIVREVKDTYFLIEIDKNVHVRVEKNSVFENAATDNKNK